MEPINHRLGILEQRPTCLVVGCPHVHTITKHLVTLLGREQIQASRGRLLIAARRHRQHLGMLRVTQIGQDGHVQLVAFLQTDLVHADIRDHTLRIDHQRLAVGQLVLDDETHRVRGDAQASRHFRFVGTDEHPQHVLFEAIRGAGVFTLERRQEIVAMMAMPTAMKDGLIAEERGLPHDIEITDDAHFANVEIGFQAGRLDGFATWTATGFGPRPGDFDAMRIGQTMIPGDGDAVGQIEIKGEVGHGRPWQRRRRDRLRADPAAAFNVGTALNTKMPSPQWLCTLRQESQRNPKNPWQREKSRQSKEPHADRRGAKSEPSNNSQAQKRHRPWSGGRSNRPRRSTV